MADNFLERRMEDLRSGKLTPRAPKRRALPLKDRYFFVNDGASESGRHLVEELRRKGATVIFSGTDAEIAKSLHSVYGAINLTSLPLSLNNFPNNTLLLNNSTAPHPDDSFSSGTALSEIINVLREYYGHEIEVYNQ